MADVSQGREMTNETLQLAASISKPISAVRAHQLVEEGVFDLDADINSYLTSWKVPENEFTSAEKVTIRRILNHTAGLTVWGFPGYDKGDTIPSVVAVLDGKGNTDPVKVYKVPGESWMYSGGGYTVLQLAMMDTEGMAFHQSMQENVLNLMNMEGSTFENPLPEKYHNMAATGYRHNGDEVEGKWPIYPEMAAAGLWTTPSMLIQYAIEIQRIYQSGEDGILKYETVKEMLVPGMNGHGLGPGVSEHTFGHGGADEGFRSRLVAWKDQPYAIVVMVNSDNGSIIDEVLISFADEYGLPGFKPAVKEVVERTEDELQKYTGKFLLDELGEVELYIEDGQLMAAGEFMDELAIFLAENDTLFFDKEDWQPIDFDLENGRVDGFNAGRFRAERVK
jgi:CubicO group peptidase (beta-lactamase class C family)